MNVVVSQLAAYAEMGQVDKRLVFEPIVIEDLTGEEEKKLWNPCCS